ncbi:daunorubicin resistance protein DrrA family ABC transporter ATP-binding protein [Glycomyces arizonensis]|uniref:daunorubicin resistance protein DrrA family ABC transporter ATP-binding protein n=1 Tax=Glycomyces arizonensis TaxID=256035 RepID=UPI000421E1DD|nr:daunorubicin resistance protein DrrA family ABC transporter ATP-binding protein [Glycomyces arizonensis]
MSYAFQAEGLVKRYGDFTALDGVDLAAEAGTVLGVLGPNGAGKTTTVRILATLLRPDAGRAIVGGCDVVAEAGRVRRLIGLTGQFASVDGELTGTENLALIGRLLDLRGNEIRARVKRLLADFDLTEAARRPVKTYSGGMRRRLDLAAGLMGRPAIVFLDEPTTGLDPAKREELWGVVRRLVADGTTVLLTTQYLDEADALADAITVIDHGRVIADGTPAELKRIVGGQSIVVRPADEADLDKCGAVLATVTGRRVDSPKRGVLSVPVGSDGDFTAVVGELDRVRIDVTELALQLPDLDDVFFKLTGHTAAEETEQEAIAA